MSFLTTFGASEAVKHPRIALPPFGGGVSGGVLSSASDEDGGGLQSAIRAEASLASEAIQYGAPDGIRTHAGAGLSRLPLPFGLRGPAMHRPGAILVRLFCLLALSCHRIPGYC